MTRLQVPANEEWNDQDFHLGKLGNNLHIIAIPGTKLAFYRSTLIAFSGSIWTVRINQWGPEPEKAMETLESGLQLEAGGIWLSEPVAPTRNARLPEKHFFWALQEHLENPRVLLDLAARQAFDSLKDL